MEDTGTATNGHGDQIKTVYPSLLPAVARSFHAPRLLELLLAGEDPLETHREDVAVVFLDLCGFTAFAETTEPEEMLSVLREYHRHMGRLVAEHDGTLERFAGDGLMVFFSPRIVGTNTALRAVRMAAIMREEIGMLKNGWRRLGYQLGFAVGIAAGYATVGAIGFEGRWDYGAVGTVTNLASRLCDHAQAGQILISARVMAKVDRYVRLEPVGELHLKGFLRPMPAFNVLRLRRLRGA